MFKSLHSSENARLVTWLKEQREDQGLTMRDLAKKLNISHSFVGKIEQGERRLDVIEYLQYCDALGVSSIDGIKAVKLGR